MRADNTHHLVASAHRRAIKTRERAVAALRRLDATGQPVSFDILASEAGVSRSWLYRQPDLRAEIERLRALSDRAPTSPPIPARQRASDTSLRRRLEVVNAEIRRLRQENQRLREQFAATLGELRAARLLGQADDQGASNPKRGRTTATTIGPCS